VSGELAAGEKLEDEGEDFVAIVAGKREGELGVQQPVGDADVVAATAGFKREVSLAPGKLREGGGELKGRRPVGRGFEDRHDRRGQDVHAEEAEILAVAKARDDQALFRFRGGWFFKDLGDFIEPLLAVHAPPAHRAVVGEFALMRALDGGDGASMGGGDVHELPGAGRAGGAHVKVIAHKEKERVIADEGARGEDRVAEPPRVLLFNERQPRRVISGRNAERSTTMESAVFECPSRSMRDWSGNARWLRPAAVMTAR
jgi:hypothetical protein